MKVHMIGIKGSGMSALAIVLKHQNHIVTGSDYSDLMFTQEELEKQGIVINPFNKDNLKDVDVVIVGHNFIDSNNIEFEEAKRLGLPIFEYHIYLANMLKKYYSIAVSGSNGKTTTTALIATILDDVENTSYLIGSGEGKGNANSQFFTFEACEYKKHFLKYYPNIILVNNIDYDHVDYFLTPEDYNQAFYEFLSHAKDKIIINGDDINLKNVKYGIIFGIENKEMFNARNIAYVNGISYDLYYKDHFIKHLHFNMYGKHMVYNTLAAITTTLSMGIEIDVVEKALKKFKGVKRRFKETIIKDDVYIDDYAHHPSKISAIIESVKLKYPQKKIIAFYRPDRVSRLNYFSSLIAKELKKTSKAYILPFIKMEEEERDSIEKFISSQPSIKLINEREYKKIAKYNNVVYLMMSSKDVSEVKENILKYKGD